MAVLQGIVAANLGKTLAIMGGVAIGAVAIMGLNFHIGGYNKLYWRPEANPKDLKYYERKNKEAADKRYYKWITELIWDKRPLPEKFLKEFESTGLPFSRVHEYLESSDKQSYHINNRQNNKKIKDVATPTPAQTDKMTYIDHSREIERIRADPTLKRRYQAVTSGRPIVDEPPVKRRPVMTVRHIINPYSKFLRPSIYHGRLKRYKKVIRRRYRPRYNVRKYSLIRTIR